MPDLRCAHCGHAAAHVLNGDRLCAPCSLLALSALTVDIAGLPGLVHELPNERARQQTRPDRVAARRKVTTGASRAAAKTLKLAHLPEYNALLANELAAGGHRPTNPRSLDVYLRQIASKRLLALSRRVGSDG